MAEAGVALMLTADPRAGESRILGDSEALLLGRGPGPAARRLRAAPARASTGTSPGRGGCATWARSPPTTARWRSCPAAARAGTSPPPGPRSEEHTSELQSLMRISYAVFCWQQKKTYTYIQPSIPKHTNI